MKEASATRSRLAAMNERYAAQLASTSIASAGEASGAPSAARLRRLANEARGHPGRASPSPQLEPPRQAPSYVVLAGHLGHAWGMVERTATDSPGHLRTRQPGGSAARNSSACTRPDAMPSMACKGSGSIIGLRLSDPARPGLRQASAPPVCKIRPPGGITAAGTTPPADQYLQTASLWVHWLCSTSWPCWPGTSSTSQPATRWPLFSDSSSRSGSNPPQVISHKSLYSRPPTSAEMKFNAAALVRTDLLTRYQAHESAVRAGWKLRSEVRDLEDLPPVAGIDDQAGGPAVA